MMYKGKNVNLAGYIALKKKDYEGKPSWMWKDEGIVYAIMDYHSSMGEFTDEDWDTINELGLDEVGQMCEEQD